MAERMQLGPRPYGGGQGGGSSQGGFGGGAARGAGAPTGAGAGAGTGKSGEFGGASSGEGKEIQIPQEEIPTINLEEEEVKPEDIPF